MRNTTILDGFSTAGTMTIVLFGSLGSGCTELLPSFSTGADDADGVTDGMDGTMDPSGTTGTTGTSPSSTTADTTGGSSGSGADGTTVGSQGTRHPIDLPGHGGDGSLDVPVRVHLDAMDVAMAGDVGQLRFFGPDQSTLLAHDVESWSERSGAEIWVRTSLESGPTTMWMAYGMPAPEPALDPEDVWGDQVLGVWHLEGDLSDASIAGHDGTAVGGRSR